MMQCLRLLRGLLLLAAALAVASGTAAAQDTLRPRYGLFGGVSFNMHRADFRALPGVPSCCPVFTGGTGLGPRFGLLFETPIAGDLLFGLRADYTAHDARLVEREGVRVIVNGVGTDGAFEHSVDATLASIGLEPGLRLRVAGGLFAGIGLRVGYLMTGDYAQEERIVDPVGVGTYLDSVGNDTRSRVRNANGGTLPSLNRLGLAGTGGVGYELPLNARGTFVIEPEVSYAFALTDIVSGVTWKADGLRAGIALKYVPRPEPPIRELRDTIIARDTTTRESASATAERVTLASATSSVARQEAPGVVLIHTTINEHYLRELPLPPLACTLAATGVNEDGAAEAIGTLRIEEFLSTIAHPLLNYVFFDSASARIPDRYTLLAPASRDAFHARDLRGSATLPVYYTVLNIIGERMRAYPAAVLTLTGCNMDVGAEKGNLNLSRGRAEALRDYLVATWGIDRSRLRVEATNLPERRSNPATPSGQAENRRVEIVSTVPEVLDVLMITDTTRTPNPPTIRLAPAVTSQRGVASWQVTVVQRGVELKRFTGTGAPPAALDWDLADDQAAMPRFDDALAITMSATAPDGRSTTCAVTLPTRVLTLRQKQESREGDFTVDRYNLILFSVGAAVVSPANQRIINLIRSRITPATKLTVEGFADRTGNPASNEQLSAKRARATAEALGRPDATTRGIGDRRLLYTNDLPEGRYYCRTVQITAKTPVAR